MPLFLGTTLLDAQMTKRSMHGKPVLPITIKKDPMINGKTAPWNEIIESGVSVKPRSFNKLAEVKMPLSMLLDTV